MSARPDTSQPLVAAPLSKLSDRVARWIGPATLGQAAFALLFLTAMTMFVAFRTTRYFQQMDAPPSFRHMDSMDLKRVLIDYLDANGAGPDTVLVLGDCVAFGHGVITPFPAMLTMPGYRILNISMQSFRYELMLVVIDHALRRGVTQFAIQLHPFEDYVAEAAFWKRLKAQRLGIAMGATPAAASLGADELLDDAEANWRVLALGGLEGTGRFYDYREHFPTATLSQALRYHVLSAWPLYRDRFAFDDWSGLNLSYYTSRTHRTDSYTQTLSEEQQRDIFKTQASFFEKFVIHDRAAYSADMTNNSAAARIAKVLSDRGALAVFIMAPTFVDKIERYSVLRPADLAFASQTMRTIVEARSFKYVDYLPDAELAAQMVHFDNLTATGQRLLAAKLQHDLEAAGFPRPRGAKVH